MIRSPLLGRRIHIAGSIDLDTKIATTAEVEQARDVIKGLVRELVKRGSTFVVPVDAEKPRPGDGRPICFDWLVWKAIADSLMLRPADAPNPLVVAVQHHKNEAQVPAQFGGLWDSLRNSDLVQIENAAYWNMNSKRLEIQARWGEILVAVGGGEGVLALANLYHDAGRPVIPLNSAVVAPGAGARRLFDLGLTSGQADRLFRSTSGNAHTGVNRINFTPRHTTVERVAGIIDLLESLEPPRAFAVRLLNPKHPDFPDVQEFFDTVVQPIVEDELGYKLLVVDGSQPYEHARLDQEIFEKLHRSSVVFADITGMRPNCFIELGYALGRGLPTMVMAKEGGEQPFDITTVSGLHWKAGDPARDRRRAFREHWDAIRSRPALVSSEPLIP